MVRSELVGEPGERVIDAWPDGIYEGPCRQETVSMLVPMSALTRADVCGRTEGHLEVGARSHRVVWLCEGCLFPGSDMRGLGIYSVVGMPEGMIPNWDVFAEIGS